MASLSLLPPFNQHTALAPRQLQHAGSSASLKAELQPSAAPIPAFRPRSSSMHQPSSSHSRVPLFDASTLPPLPSLPPTPAQASRSQPEEVPPDTRRYRPLIKSVTVVHHIKTGKSWAFACRVIPAASAPLDHADAMNVPTRRRESLGRMAMAGRLEYELREPYTVYRTWGDFVELSSQLANVFPVVSPADHGVSSSALPSTFFRQVPRLSKKITLFVTRSTLTQRQAELDLFTRRLFEMPDQVCQSRLVRDFFMLRREDAAPLALLPSLSPNPADDTWGQVAGEEPESFATFLAGLDSPNATIRPIAAKSRPPLHVKKSTPNLRLALLKHDDALEDLSVPKRPGMATPTSDATNVRSSIYSVSTMASTSSSATVTPMTFAAASSMRAKSPLSNEDLASEAVKPEPKTKRRPGLGPLRHFRSLQDLRSEKSSPVYPTEPVPKLPLPRKMVRAVTQPHPFLDSVPNAAASPTTSHARQRSGSNSSLDDLWGTTSAVPSSTDLRHATFRRTPSGRIDRVVPDDPVRPRRPSLPRRLSTSAARGHNPSLSTSSVGSSRSSFSMELGRSHRSSTEYSEVTTPQTPHSEYAASFKDPNETHVNMVPLPPFFPVPPPSSSAMQVAFSHDGLPHTPKHRRNRSSDPRTARRPLDTILASPLAPPPDRVTFKLLHPLANVIIRTQRENLTLAKLRSLVREKYDASACGVVLEGDWGLACASEATRLVITDQDLRAVLGDTQSDKVALKVVC
ncbi:hypothetical protein OIV83_001597 [Microbotryomycetes sp. JL201]|nr:hypothetical protein OIV83_001597 [Microbotryomycetes sp. JL201]